MRHKGLIGIAAVLAAIAAGGLAAQATAAEVERLYAKILAPLSESENGEAIGTLTPGTEVAVIAERPGRWEVEVHGWSAPGAESILFIAPGQRIVLARLKLSAAAIRTIEGTKTDRFGQKWERIRVRGWVDRNALVEDVSVVWKKAARIFHKRCTACHALHQPTEFTANQWPHILKIMTKRAALSKKKATLVTKYLQMHAKDRSPSG